MSELEYLNPSDWSLHVIDGENECVPEGWILVPEDAEVYSEFADRKIFLKFNEEIVFGYIKDVFEILPIWSKKEIIVDRKSRILWTRKMKEYLVERDGKYELVEAYHLDGGIEVPEGAIAATAYDNKKHLLFWREGKRHHCFNPRNNDGWFVGATKLAEYLERHDYSKIVWKRNPSLSDQYAEIEKVCQNSSVSNPKHYTSHPSGIECIEITRHHDFAIGNAIKYLWRAGLKDSDNEIQDLEKAAWYIQDKIKQLKGGK